MAENFYTILTNTGKAKIANATALGTKVNFTTLKVGDSNGTYYNPTETQEDLVHTVWNGNINSITTDPDNPNWITIAVVIPSNVGGFVIREVGIFDDEGDMLAIGKYPETYKPQVSDGSTKDITIRMILEVSNSASVTLKVDPTVTLATKADLNALAGKGRTTETVKGNTDNIAKLNNKVLSGTGTFKGTAGVTINHTANTTDYVVHITIASADPEGAVGVYWVENKTSTSFVVKNTDGIGINFDWILVKE
ncbi:phage tail protein [Clostridium sp. LBM24168]